MKRRSFLTYFVVIGAMLVLAATPALCFDRDSLSHSMLPGRELVTDLLSVEKFPDFPSLLREDPPDQWINGSAPRWYYLPTINGIAANPNNPSIVYAATYNGLYKSSDAGMSWQRRKRGVARNVTVHPMFPIVVFECRYDGIYRSTDHGDSWTKILSAGGGADVVAVDPVRPNIVYAGIQEWTGVEDFYEGKFMKSTNAGQTWVMMGESVWNWVILDIDVHPENPDMVFLGSNFTARGIQKSTDGGQTWTLPLPGLKAHSIAIDPVNPDIVYIGSTAFGVFKSIDCGDTWASMNSGLPDSSTLGAAHVAIDPRNTDLVYVGTLRGIFRSEDGGESWTDMNGNLPDRTISALTPDLTSPEGSLILGIEGGLTYYGSQGGGIFKNDGSDWTLTSTGIEQEYYVAVIKALAIHPHYSQVIYAGGYLTPTLEYMTLENAMLFISVDSGENWTPLRAGWAGGEPEVPGRVQDVLIHPVSHNIVYACASDGLRISQDYGLTWEHANLTCVVYSIAMDPVNTDVLYAGFNNGAEDTGGICKSTNGGWDWFPVNNGIAEPEHQAFESILVDPTDPDIVYARCGRGVYKTMNGGESWILASAFGGDAKAFCMDPVNTSILYGANSREVWKTTDGGETWNLMYTFDNVGGVGMQSLLIDPVDPSTLFLFKGNLEFLKSKDSGKTWTEMDEGMLDAADEGTMALCPGRRDKLYTAYWHHAPWSGHFKSFERSINLVLIPETNEVLPGQMLGFDASLTNFLNQGVTADAVMDVYLDEDLISHVDPTEIILKPKQTLSDRFELEVPSDASPGSVLRVLVQIGEEPDYDTDWDAFEVTVVSPARLTAGVTQRH